MILGKSISKFFIIPGWILLLSETNDRIEKTRMEEIQMKTLLFMIFMHIVDDYYLQGCLANMKQKSWWKSHPNYSEKYKLDYIVALAMHSFSWSFCVMLPVAIYNRFDCGIIFYICFIANILTHAITDNEKANRFTINLVQDQMIHLMQILLTFLFLCR